MILNLLTDFWYSFNITNFVLKSFVYLGSFLFWLESNFCSPSCWCHFLLRFFLFGRRKNLAKVWVDSSGELFFFCFDSFFSFKDDIILVVGPCYYFRLAITLPSKKNLPHMYILAANWVTIKLIKVYIQNFVNSQRIKYFHFFLIINLSSLKCNF